jgi:hypothetical protein
MKKLVALAFAASASAAVIPPALAHHSFSMFDPGQEVVIEGEVQRWAYNSPHTFMLIKDGEGKVWAFEGAAPPALLSRNPPMQGDTFSIGQKITVIVCPLRDGRAGGAAGLFFAEDGTVYNPSDAGCGANQRIKEWTEWLAAGHKSRAEAEGAPK